MIMLLRLPAATSTTTAIAVALRYILLPLVMETNVTDPAVSLSVPEHGCQPDNRYIGGSRYFTDCGYSVGQCCTPVSGD